jgi:hypothetical protein
MHCLLLNCKDMLSFENTRSRASVAETIPPEDKDIAGEERADQHFRILSPVSLKIFLISKSCFLLAGKTTKRKVIDIFVDYYLFFSYYIIHDFVKTKRSM